MDKVIKNKRGLELVAFRSSGSSGNKFEKISSLVSPSLMV